MSKTPLLSATKLTKEYGGRALFQDITLVVNEEDKVVLIGPNGSGKSTLLRILANEVEPDAGEVRARRGLHVAYVAQQDVFDENLTPREVIEAALIKASIDQTDIPRRTSLALGRCGFDDPDVLVSSLSGGWKKRLAIARGFALEPELLLLDEPTNHLDVDGIQWLEEELTKSRSAVVLVSHDRWFIERLASRVIEIDKRYPSGCFECAGGYADFIERRSEFFANLRATKASLANKVRREVEWLRQGVKARRTKSRSRIDEAHRLIDELKGIKLDSDRASIEFSATKRKTKELIKLEHVSKAFHGQKLFSDVSLVLTPGSRLGVVGPNGSGKSTFVNVLLGKLAPDRGRVVLASQLKTAVFDQARRELPRAVTLKEALCPEGDSVVFNGESLHVAAWAARFSFAPTQLSLPVSQLSGGEQARALLARLMLTDADVLLFDEPTNDLDIPTLEVLEDAFVEFPGAIVLVTHDRYFLDRVATIVLGISRQFTGIFADYFQWELARTEVGDPRTALRTKDSATPHSSAQAKTKTKLGYQEQRELQGMEKSILAAEAKVQALEAELSKDEVASNAERLNVLCGDLAVARDEVERLYARWEELEDKRKSFQSN